MGGCTSSSKPVSQQPESQVSQPKLKSESPIPLSTPQSQSSKASILPNDFKAIHSAVRWNKQPIEEITAILSTQEARECTDPKNGNSVLHIAAQNGHFNIVKFLLEKKVTINVKNLKGNTPLHMAIAYNYFDSAQALIDAGADDSIQNEAGHPASRGLDGDKSLALSALVSASTAAEADRALDMCEIMFSLLEKASYIQAGLKLKKMLGDDWTEIRQDKFKRILEMLK